MREDVEGMKDWVVDCLRKPETGCREGEGRKKTMVKVIELNSEMVFLGSAEVEEYEVC